MKKRSNKWVVLDDGEVVYVIPETDTKPHGIRKGSELKVELADINCACNPKVSFSNKKVLVIHNSFEEKLYLDKLLQF